MKSGFPETRDKQVINTWLLKTEPSSYSLDDLLNCDKRCDTWEGVRNYQARNLIRDQIMPGDLALFYHSGKAPAAIAVVEIITAGYPDDTALDPRSPYYDPRSTIENPRWFRMDVRWLDNLPRPVPLKAMRAEPRLATMALLKKGQRLSVLPVEPHEWRIIMTMGQYTT